MNSADAALYLASRSPRRRELLAQIGVRYRLLLFRAQPGRESDVSETPRPGEAPREYVERVARVKAEMGWLALLERNLPRGPVLSADTTVTLEGRIFGKPADRREALDMLRALSGRTHEVLTAAAVKFEDFTDRALSVSQVTFKALREDEIEQYVASGECFDKAGGYAIQGRAARFISGLQGSYSGVMGLDLFQTAALLERLERRHG